MYLRGRSPDQALHRRQITRRDGRGDQDRRPGRGGVHRADVQPFQVVHGAGLQLAALQVPVRDGAAADAVPGAAARRRRQQRRPPRRQAYARADRRRRHRQRARRPCPGPAPAQRGGYERQPAAAAPATPRAELVRRRRHGRCAGRPGPRRCGVRAVPRRCDGCGGVRRARLWARWAGHGQHGHGRRYQRPVHGRWPLELQPSPGPGISWLWVVVRARGVLSSELLGSFGLLRLRRKANAIWIAGSGMMSRELLGLEYGERKHHWEFRNLAN